MYLFHLMMVLGCVKKTTPKIASPEPNGALVSQEKLDEVPDKETQQSNGDTESEVKQNQQDNPNRHMDLPPGVVMGALDKSLIDAEIKKHLSNIKSCYAQQLQSNPSLSGRIVIKFVIAKDGFVSKSEAKEDTVGSDAVTTCILEQFSKMQFPEPKGGGIVIISYPFAFSPD